MTRLVLVGLLWATPLAAREIPAQEEKVKVAFSGIDLEALAHQVELVTKRTFLYQDQLLKGKKVTLQSEKPITPDEFYRVFQSVCLMHGLALVPAPEENIHLVKVVPSAQAAKEPGAQPVLLRGEPLPPGDSLVYYVVAPKHVSPAKAAAVLSPVTSGTGSVQQVPNSDLLLLIDVASSVQRAEKLLSIVDVEGEPVSVAAVTLEHLGAGQAKTQLTEFVQAVEKVATGEMGRSRLEVLADDRLGTIHLVGRAPEVKRASDFLREIERQLPSVKRTIGYYRLKNVPVGTVADNVRQFLGLAVSVREADRRRAAGGPKAAPLSGGPTLPPGVTPPLPPKSQEEPTAPQAAPPPPSAKTPGAPPTGIGPSTDIEIVALESQNTLVVIGNQAVHEEVKKILENLDRRKGQILIEVAILQVTGDDSLDVGIEGLFSKTKSNGATLNGGTGFGEGTQSGGTSGFPTSQTLTSFTGGAFRYLKADDISVLVKAISTKSQVNILSQPLLLVNDNEDANFTTKVSEPTLVTSQGTSSTLTSFAGFADATTSLTITPQISPDGYINLKITQTFEEFSGTSAAAGVPPPKISNNVQTQITVPDRYTAIMGGFTRDSLTDTRSGVPFLMDIPIVNWFTSSRTQDLSKSRLYLFVRPRILSSEGFSDLKKASEEKAKDAGTLIEDPRVQGEFKRSLAPREEGVREAPLPFPEK
jgi:general secretion pathway protein D